MLFYFETNLDFSFFLINLLNLFSKNSRSTLKHLTSLNVSQYDIRWLFNKYIENNFDFFICLIN